jgi:single-strand DNA-binding protein
MAFDNTITVVGNVTREPELRFTNSGQAMATFGLAWNRKWTNRQTGQQEEQVSFFDVTCWGQMAENAAESLPKGARVIVVGRLDQRSWETQDGDKRSKVEIQAEDIAPSLKWATAQITKNERRGGDWDGGGRGGSGSGAGDPGPTPPPGGGYNPDEEPF